MKTNVALIGFMGVGKTSVGKILAKRLGRKYAEVDSLIVQKAGKSITEIFEQDGEIAFRDIEIAVIKEVASKGNLVIDCGGGVVLNKINIDRLKLNAVIVWLTASQDTILKRTSSDGDGRPLLKKNNGISDIRSSIRSRKPYYEQAADIKVDTTYLDVESVVLQIIGKLKENEDFH